MSHFFKTELGQTALQERSIALTARQRRLLLLIDHEDFKELDQDYKQRIAPTELVQQLIDMGLLAEQTTPIVQTENVVSELKVNDLKTPSEPITAQEITAIVPKPIEVELKPETEPEIIELEKLPFVEIQQVMIQTLTTYCGLMARPLIQKIQSISSLQQLKACQMQWITSLQESRIPPTQLNQTLKLINYSVQHL